MVSLLSKSVLFTKSACFNLAAKSSVVNLLNSWLLIYLELSGNLFSASLMFVFETIVVTKPLESGISFSPSSILLYWFLNCSRLFTCL